MVGWRARNIYTRQEGKGNKCVRHIIEEEPNGSSCWGFYAYSKNDSRVRRADHVRPSLVCKKAVGSFPSPRNEVGSKTTLGINGNIICSDIQGICHRLHTLPLTSYDDSILKKWKPSNLFGAVRPPDRPSPHRLIKPNTPGVRQARRGGGREMGVVQRLQSTTVMR